MSGRQNTPGQQGATSGLGVWSPRVKSVATGAGYPHTETLDLFVCAHVLQVCVCVLVFVHMLVYVCVCVLHVIYAPHKQNAYGHLAITLTVDELIGHPNPFQCAFVWVVLWVILRCLCVGCIVGHVSVRKTKTGGPSFQILLWWRSHRVCVPDGPGRATTQGLSNLAWGGERGI